MEAQNEADSGLSGTEISISDETDMKYGTSDGTSESERIYRDYSLRCSNLSSSGVKKTGALQYMSLN